MLVFYGTWAESLIRVVAHAFYMAKAVIRQSRTTIGTCSVAFHPVQVDGKLQGCNLAFKAVQRDIANLGDNYVVVVGNIGIQQTGAYLILTLEIGLKDLVENTIVLPNFAYLQSKTYSTETVKQYVREGEEGFRLYSYSLLDSPVLNLCTEFIDSGKVTVAFNRRKNGKEVLVPLDLNIVDSEGSADNRGVRRRSSEALANFAYCYSILAKPSEHTLDQNGGFEDEVQF